MRQNRRGGDERGEDEPEETRTAESWERDVGVRTFWSFLFVSLVSVCGTAGTEVGLHTVTFTHRLSLSHPDFVPPRRGGRGSAPAFSFKNAKKVDILEL